MANSLYSILSAVQTSQEIDHTSWEKKKKIKKKIDSLVEKKCSFWITKVMTMKAGLWARHNDDHGEVFCIIMAKSVWAHALSIPPGWAAQTPHPEKDLGGYYFPVPCILFSTRVKHNLQPEWEQTMLRGINLETKTQHMSCYTWKAKSRHSLRPTDPSPVPSATQSLCLG